MSQSEESTCSRALTFIGGIGAFLIFAIVLFVAYLPNRPAPADQAANDTRQAKADEARAAGLSKLNGYAVINAEAGTVQIPLNEAMELTVAKYAAEK